MLRTLFVLDYDETYNFERVDDIGVAPTVYCVPEEDIKVVQECADRAHNAFHSDGVSDMCLGDYFVEFLTDMKVLFLEVGEINIPSNERQGDYLTENICISII